MAHSGKTFTFATDVNPNANLIYNLGSTNAKWNLYVNEINGAIPALTDTNTLQNITLATTSKAFITGVTTTPLDSAAALEGVADTGVYLTTTAGALSAVNYSWNVSGTEKAHTVYNSTDDTIDFVFD